MLNDLFLLSCASTFPGVYSSSIVNHQETKEIHQIHVSHIIPRMYTNAVPKSQSILCHVCFTSTSNACLRCLISPSSLYARSHVPSSIFPVKRCPVQSYPSMFAIFQATAHQGIAFHSILSPIQPPLHPNLDNRLNWRDERCAGCNSVVMSWSCLYSSFYNPFVSKSPVENDDIYLVYLSIGYKVF